MPSLRPFPLLSFAALIGVIASPVAAQQESGDDKPPAKRTRVFLGPQIFPEYPGAKDFGIGPFIDVSRSPVGTPFQYEAPDDSFGLDAIKSDKFAIGVSGNYIRKRRTSDVGGNLSEVGRSVELGVYALGWISPEFRLRGEVRKAVSGHDGWVGDIGADYVARDGDNWLLSVGPRVTLGDDKFQRAYFGVTPAESAASGLAAYDPSGGVRSVGLMVGYLRQLTPRWGIASYARYDRLVGDAADSPVTRSFGSRSQPSAGLAVTYTFGGDR